MSRACFAIFNRSVSPGCLRNVCFSSESGQARADVTKSIRSIYADHRADWQEVAIPPQDGRIKAGRATTVQKQSVLASKLISEKTRELTKRNF
jgi:hypothetical protein